MLDFNLLYHRGVSESGLAALDIHIVSCSLEMIVHNWQKFLTQDHKNVPSDNFFLL
jgi:hypothetical protein